MRNGSKGREEKTQTLKQNLRSLFLSLLERSARIPLRARGSAARAHTLAHTLTHSHTQTEPAERGKNEEELARTFQLS